MTMILSGDNGVTFPNSTVQASAGQILQVVNIAKTDTFSTSSTSMVDITGFSLLITPKFTTSKILILINVNIGPAQSNFATVNLVRNGTNIAQPTTSSTYAATMNSYPGDAGGIAQIQYALNWLDSPATTSSVTYKLQMLTTGGTAWVNARPIAQNGTTVSGITAMEIAA